MKAKILLVGLLVSTLAITGCASDEEVEKGESSEVMALQNEAEVSSNSQVENIEEDNNFVAVEDENNVEKVVEKKDENTNITVEEKKTENNKNKKVDLDITEKMYVTYINEIYTNPSNYLGKRLKIEGMFSAQYVQATNTTYYYVYRRGPGCCGNDGSMCGFEFTTSSGYPNEDDWIEVIGTLEQYDENGTKYLTIKADSVVVKSERGAEVVSQ